MTEQRKGWTAEQSRQWSLAFGVIGVLWAFAWFGTNFWFFGLSSIVCLAMSFWADLDANRHG